MTKWLERLDSAVLIGASAAFAYGFTQPAAFAASAVLFYSSRLTFKKLMHATLVEVQDALVKDAGPPAEPGYRETAKVESGSRVLCKDCKFLGTGRNQSDCLASPVPSLLGPIDQITGEYRPQNYKLAIMVNEKFNCEKWAAK